MLNGDGNENGIKFNRSELAKKKTNCTCSTLFLLISKKEIFACSTLFVFLCCYFAQLQRCFVGLRACLHGGGGPQVSEVTRLGGVAHPSM